MNIQKLIQGHKKFKDNIYKNYKQDFEALIENGQKPKVLFIGCSDSRVSPDLIFHSRPGDMFTTRNIGNFVPPYKVNDDFHGTTAVIEYAVNILKVEDIIVCGHSHCGACKALFDDNIKQDKNLSHVAKWLELGYEAKEIAKNICQGDKSKLAKTVEQESIKIQLKNILTYPMINRLVKTNKINIHGWYYDIPNGTISNYDKNKNIFKEI
ncbi:MAG: carbonic anhydrase [Epsilonproteobacteria bacterium]|nr:MAG: carbonic anhydrase [Campylobacterota bacterium]